MSADCHCIIKNRTFYLDNTPKKYILCTSVLTCSSRRLKRSTWTMIHFGIWAHVWIWGTKSCSLNRVFNTVCTCLNQTSKKLDPFECRKFGSIWMKIYFLVKTDSSDSEIWSKSCRRRTGRSESSIKQIGVRTAQREIIQLAPVFFLHWDNMTSKQPRTLQTGKKKKKKEEERRGLFFLVWGVVKQQRSTAWTAGKKGRW